MATTNINIEFNDDQKAAIESVMAWFRGWHDRKHRKQTYFLAGYAGTGKTSLARHIAELVGGEARVVFIAPTGKAASRLRQKGCRYAKTMHQFIYNVRGENEEGEPIFVAKGAVEERPILIVLDEASMLGSYDFKNLISHNIPVLGLGDTGQVPPVKDTPAFKEGEEDIILETIERQALDSNIVRASMFVRQGKRLPVREYSDVRVREGQPSIEDIKEHIGEDAVILCSYNSTRTDLNQRIRRMLGYTGETPQIGEKVVCTFNQHGAGFMNGEQGIVLGYRDMYELERDDNDKDAGCIMMRMKSLTTGHEKNVKINMASFDRNEEVRKLAQKTLGGFDFGYVLTTHKSQGSEWSKVMVIEEILRGVPYSKMMYTQITRAIDQLTIYRG